jgi:hypothetical protein
MEALMHLRQQRELAHLSQLRELTHFTFRFRV